jgi:hypothetical protein
MWLCIRGRGYLGGWDGCLRQDWLDALGGVALGVDGMD